MKKQNPLNEIEIALMPVPDVIVLPETTTSFTLTDTYYINMIRDLAKNNQLLVISMTDQVRDENNPEKQILKPRDMGIVVIPTLLSYSESLGQNILFQGLYKVRIKKIISKSPYLKCQAEIIPEDQKFFEISKEKSYQDLQGTLESWIEKNVEDKNSQKNFLAGLNSPEMVMNYVTLFVIKCRETKQLILETLSLMDRFDILSLFFLYQGKNNYPLLTVDILRSYIMHEGPEEYISH